MEKINIIGAGLAGLSAAITLAEQNISTNLISLQSSERAQSVLAEGGINGALNTMGEEDTPQNHMEDTLRAGVYLADVEAVRGLTEEAPDIIRYLERLGVAFHTKNEEIVLRNFGGQKKKRTAYARSSTGKIIMSAMIDEARKFEAKGLITRFSHHAFQKLEVREASMSSDGQDCLAMREKMDVQEDLGAKGDLASCCEGVWVKDIYATNAAEMEELSLLKGPVILAMGGMNGMFPELTTGTTANSGDALAQLFAQGVRLGNLEMIQYHPTTIRIPGKRCLVTEAARGEGGRLYVMRDGKPWYFMEEKYPELKNLMPRDVVSREIYFVKVDPTCGDQVYLDMTGLSEEVWQKKLPDLRAELMRYLSLDPKHAPIPVDPGIHYFMGGIHVDRQHRTNIDNLYAAGECCDQYHGANRLGGNSMLGAIYGGRVAARTVAERMRRAGTEQKRWADMRGATGQEGELPREQTGECELSQEQTSECERRSWDMTSMSDISSWLVYEVRDILASALGIVRNGDSLEKADEALEALLKHKDLNQREKNRVCLARAVVGSARFRKESRGAHYREDYPEKDEAFRGITVTQMKCDGSVTISLEE